jgi:exopolysaccharide biosynthesis protein
MLGIDRAGYAWLVTVDGRQPDASNGMTLVELQKLAKRLGLTDALNLDGGGSTTMVILGSIVNHPSDPTGARTVSDVLLVVPRPHRPLAR